ncbi:MAG TPA: tetratricopeptide repeat protein [Bryobacteraceae bacterium]|nr:tetratricopeptide repeat protein [Bryobacteraceae bacterium]
MLAALLAPLAFFFQAAPQAADGPCDLARSASLREKARSALQGHQYDQAAQEFQEALHACPRQHAILLEVSEAQTHRRDFAEAIRAAQEFLALEPNSLSGSLVLGNAYFMAGRFAEARGVAERVLEREPGHATALKLKGNIQFVTGETARAKDTFMSLLDQHPDDAEAAYMLGRIYYQEGRVEYAMGQFQRALKLDPLSYKAYDNLGLCYEARGETDMALRHFLTAIKLVDQDHPDYDWVYANLANLLLETGDAKQAFAAASKAADRNPNSARNFYIGGKALCKLEKTDLCVNWLERSTALDPNYPEPLYLLAKAYGQLGQKQKAKETFEKFRQVKAKELSGQR